MKNKEIKENLKKGFLLDIDDYGQTKNYSNLIGVATQVQRLLFIEPGSYPNNPDIGIGIKSYSFEFGDDTTIADLKAKINYQVNKYIDHIITADVKVIKENSVLYNTLAIRFDLGEVPANKYEKQEFVLTFTPNETNTNLISQIYI